MLSLWVPYSRAFCFHPFLWDSIISRAIVTSIAHALQSYLVLLTFYVMMCKSCFHNICCHFWLHIGMYKVWEELYHAAVHVGVVYVVDLYNYSKFVLT